MTAVPTAEASAGSSTSPRQRPSAWDYWREAPHGCKSSWSSTHPKSQPQTWMTRSRTLSECAPTPLERPTVSSMRPPARALVGRDRGTRRVRGYAGVDGTVFTLRERRDVVAQSDGLNPRGGVLDFYTLHGPPARTCRAAGSYREGLPGALNLRPPRHC